MHDAKEREKNEKIKVTESRRKVRAVCRNQIKKVPATYTHMFQCLTTASYGLFTFKVRREGENERNSEK